MLCILPVESVVPESFPFLLQPVDVIKNNKSDKIAAFIKIFMLWFIFSK
jgi:hypothetical protein